MTTLTPTSDNDQANGSSVPQILIRKSSSTIAPTLSKHSSNISLCSSIPTTMETLDDMVLECERITNMYLNENNVIQAIDELDKRRDVNFSFLTLKALFLTQGATVTGGDEMMKIAQAAINDAFAAVSKYRKRKSKLLRVIWSENYEKYDELELFAEMAHLYLSAMNMITILGLERTLIGLIKTGYYAKTCMDTMNECKNICKKRTKWSTARVKETFEHATYLSIGMYNFFISLLPPRVLKLLQFIGFDGNRKKALKYIEKVSFGNSIWSDFGAFTLLMIHLQFDVITGLGVSESKLCHKLLTNSRRKAPDSGFYLIFEGIFEQVQGNPGKAIELLHRSRAKFNQWVEWQNACYWLIMWCHAIQCEWDKAVECAQILNKSCNWSKCVFTYQIACFKTMVLDDLDSNSRDADIIGRRLELKDEIDNLLTEAPKLKKTIVGKTLTFEKFVTKRCEMYLSEQSKNNNQDQETTLILPVIEQLLFWNIFAMSKKSPKYLQIYVDMIDKKLKNNFNLGAISDESSFELEKYYNLILMKGVILHYMNRADEAVNLFKLVLENESEMKIYNHLAPLACLELGIILRSSPISEEVDEAEAYLTRATTKYNHYLNETMVHIRAYNALADIKEKRRLRHDSDIGRTRTRSSSIASLLSYLSISRNSSPDSRRGSDSSPIPGRRNSTGSFKKLDENDDEFVDCPEAID